MGVFNYNQADKALSNVVLETPLDILDNFRGRAGSEIIAKREDLQIVRSFKIRGAYYKISSLKDEEKSRGIICASAGNHAQGVAYACQHLKIRGTIFMPSTTPKQKIKQVEFHGKNWINIVLEGDSFDQANEMALQESKNSKATFVPPFNSLEVIHGQGTLALEMLRQVKEGIDYLFIPIGGGGLAAGMSEVFRHHSPETKLIGVEPEGAPAMQKALKAGWPVYLDVIDTFTDGAAVKQVGDIPFNICKNTLDEVITVPEGLICETILRLYDENAIVAEPAGALALAGAMTYEGPKPEDRLAVILSGGNNDMSRFPEFKERALLYKKLKHYFIIRFPQRPGALKEFVMDVLGPDDDIVHFEYSKKTARENGPALIGIELKTPEDFKPLLRRMKERNFYSDYVNELPDLMNYLV